MAKPIDNHGLAGYRRGCRCETCRKAHREAAAEYRARKRRPVEAPAAAPAPLEPLTDVPTLDVRAAPGPVETALRAELGALVGEPPWRQTLGALLLANARVIDQVPRHERFDVLSGLQTRMLEQLDRLRKVDARGTGDLERILGGLGDATG